MKDTLVQIGLVVLGVLLLVGVVFGLFQTSSTDFATEGHSKVEGAETILKAAEINYK